MPAEVLHSAIVSVLAREIVEGELREGDAIRLEQIQARFEVSRTVAREVMRSLEAVRMLEARRSVGLVVRALADWDLLDPRVVTWRLGGSTRAAQLASLTELRLAIEPAAARSAAIHAAGADRDRLVELAEHLARSANAGARDAFLTADIAYHSLLLRASGNELFAAMQELFAATLSGRTRGGLMPHHPSSTAVDGHLLVARSVRQGDADDAHGAMDELLGGLRRELAARWISPTEERMGR
ncbi:FadR/GntR family transcriptional regulator [Arenivirga flava]|uniref:GntR family transcriptional regulator n=1 Tax=Arenivirga flava TaxID=1930060 RepID=A0AA37UFW3_9MICO|nr:FCD domain-containing protein [Arenivirga flava]GMA28555.1 GntR family transcriptional regulator [Arenivirga flava]